MLELGEAFFHGRADGGHGDHGGQAQVSEDGRRADDDFVKTLIWNTCQNALYRLILKPFYFHYYIFPGVMLKTKP